jgi:hypothetical protein
MIQARAPIADEERIFVEMPCNNNHFHFHFHFPQSSTITQSTVELASFRVSPSLNQEREGMSGNKEWMMKNGLTKAHIQIQTQTQTHVDGRKE